MSRSAHAATLRPPLAVCLCARWGGALTMATQLLGFGGVRARRRDGGGEGRGRAGADPGSLCPCDCGGPCAEPQHLCGGEGRASFPARGQWGERQGSAALSQEVDGLPGGREGENSVCPSSAGQGHSSGPQGLRGGEGRNPERQRAGRGEAAAVQPGQMPCPPSTPSCDALSPSRLCSPSPPRPLPPSLSLPILSPYRLSCHH